MINSAKSASNLKGFSLLCSDPKGAYEKMLSNFKFTEKYLIKTVIRNMFITMIALKIGTEEVNSVAKSVVQDQRGKLKVEVVRIMKIRLQSIRRDIRTYRQKMHNEDQKVIKMLNKDQYIIFKEIRKEFKDYIWRITINRCKKKVRHIIQKRRKEEACERNRKYSTEGERFYKVLDKELSNVEPIHSSNFVVYGIDNIRKEEEDCLSLGPKYMVTPKLEKEDFEVEVEMECTKTRLEILKRKKVEVEGEVLEELVEEEEKDYREDKLIYENGVLNMSKMAVTDAKYNLRSFPPRETSAEEEIKIQARKQGILKAFDEFQSDICSDSRGQNKINLTDTQKIGKQMLQDRIRKGEIIITTTDKSGKFAVVEPSLYKKAATAHLKDEEIDHKSVIETENLLNRHSAQLLKAFRMGSKHGEHGQEQRIKQAFTSKGGKPGPLFFLIKDHKKVKEGEEIPPVRPVCSAKGGPGSRLSNLITTILNKVGDSLDATTECRSTEEALRTILETNRELEIKCRNDKKVKEMKIMSMDVKSLYPSLKIDEVGPIINDIITTSQEKGVFTFENMDMEEVGKYLAIMMPREEQEMKNLASVLPTRKLGENSRGRKPGPAFWESDSITREIQGRKIKIDKWEFNEEPNEEQRMKMISGMIKIAIETSMKNHLYRFDGKVFRQSDGGPIGDELSQAVARLIMIWWDNEFIRLCKELKVELLMFLRYVDDTNLAVIPQPPGTRYKNRKLYIDEQMIELDKQLGVDKTTGRLMRTIADDITPMLKFEEDVSSNYNDCRLPVLDFKVWIEILEEKVALKHTFYKKPMANTTTIQANTAYPVSKIRSILVEETLRRLRNCSPEEEWEERGRHLTEFAMSMKNSGHSEFFRNTVMSKAVERYKKELLKHQEGKEDIYRSREVRNEQVAKRGGKANKETWFRKCNSENEKITSVLKVPFSNGLLKRNICKVVENCEDPEGTKTKIIEGEGSRLRDMLVQPDPFPKLKCARDDCQTKRKNGQDCRETCFQGHVNYTIECDDCEKDQDRKCIYIGETGRGCYERFKGHKEQYRYKKGFMWKHAEEEHSGRLDVSFSIFRHRIDQDPMRRILRESIRIVNAEKDNSVKLMNTKEEYFGVKTVRPYFTQN